MAHERMRLRDNKEVAGQVIERTDSYISIEYETTTTVTRVPDAFEPAPNVFAAVVPVTSDMIFHQLISAFEGGSTYWVDSADLVSPEAPKVSERIVWWGRTKALYECDFDILVTEEEEHKLGAGREHHLTPESIQRGIQVMATKYPWHFKDVVNESGDATTGDVFLQCCLFGEIIYG